ncbi:MAG TPA: large conductance mechanosensitive channel protein MscL [Solirubrobacterales bacterium]|nr:large conductance mechanosensitive channel protein MscL [Solirubrobacterales bacterium]
MKIILGYKDFISRGSVIDLAVAVVIGAAFTALVSSMVADLLTPIIAAIFGEPDFSGLSFTIRGSEFTYGNFINALLSFLSVTLVIYFFVVVPMNRIKGQEDETHRDCPECFTEIPVQATRCAHCTTRVTPTG